MPALRRKAIRGAVALEYILITALVAMALIGAFRMWGKRVAIAVGETSRSPVGGYDPKTGIGGALKSP